MQVTKNYGLIKQELTDAADITQISQNWDKIDTELKKLDDEKFDKAGGTITGATTVNGKITAKGGESVAGGLTVTGGTTTDTLKATGAITVGSVTTTGGVSAGSMTVTGDATVNGKILVDNIRAKGGSNALQVGVNNPNSTEELLGIIAQWVNGTTPRVSVTHHPDKASNDKSVATTYWIKQLIATQSEYGLVKLASEEDLLNEAPQNAICTELIYDINEFRRKSKAYKVGEKVDCAFQYERFLECTKAGTTSANLLDTRNVTHGQKITDGTVEWTVRTHARSVNNNVADANGNVSIPSYSHPNSGVQVGNYNTVQVNEQGHVTGGANIDYVKSVNGNSPDSKGNVDVKVGLDESDVKRIVLDTFFPVGSTYISSDESFNPNVKFGGTWSKIKNRFLLGSGTNPVGAIGGEEKVTLTIDQIPQHTHGANSSHIGDHTHDRGEMNIWGQFDGILNHAAMGVNGCMEKSLYIGSAWSAYKAGGGNYDSNISTTTINALRNWGGQLSYAGGHSHTITVENTGGGQVHNNMPPYEVVNIWKRTA